ncbi:MAG: [NiFe]-hydrogenase assembly chaperone HybE [Planctomycetes bacterium]|nr:[NiFe]-hydrogenase assembly chaperone HybE [Planctomycetota bacterium]
MSVAVEHLVEYYQGVFEARFRGLPIINPSLEVEAVGFRPLDEHEFGALITPWFINLVLLPGTGRWDDSPQGSICNIEFPGGKVDFTVSHDEELGTTLSAAMFGTVADFPEQAMARDIAGETLRLLFSKPQIDDDAKGARMTRRELFRNLGSAAGDEP